MRRDVHELPLIFLTFVTEVLIGAMFAVAMPDDAFLMPEED